VTTVGILGGGQLGRMLALAGVPLGIRCLAVDPAPDAPPAAAEVLRPRSTTQAHWPSWPGAATW
jgi:phosphoribosylaminoimidazole carboxylase (NCAIR synthetase)